MSKLASPILLRSKIIPNYINSIYIKLNKKLTYLTYFKFFQILFNLIYLLKLKVLNSNLNKKFLYLNCDYYDFYTISINLNFLKLLKPNLKYIFIQIFLLSNYINYFIKFYLYSFNLFIQIFLKKSKYLNNNLFYIISIIKRYIKQKKNLKYKLTKFLNILLNNKFRNSLYIRGIKLIYSGCINKGGSKTKTIKYTKGNISFSRISSNLLYINDSVNTEKGLIGIKLWIYIN